MALCDNAIRHLYTAAVANNDIHSVSRHHYEGVDGLGLRSKPVIMVIHHAPSRPIFGGWRKLPFFGWFTLIDGVIDKMKPIQYIIIISYTIKVIWTGYIMLVTLVGPVNRHQGSSYLRKSGTYFVGYLDIPTDFCAIQTPNIKRHTLISLWNDILVALTCLHVCRWCNPH